MADFNSPVVRHRGRAGPVPKPLKRPLGSSLAVSVYLVPRCAQAGDTVPLEIAFPSGAFRYG